jgi:tRNA-dihydrouridine synthase B
MSYWHSDIKIGSLSVPRFIGGPLDGITDSPFRQLVREFSSRELLFTEMRHVATIANDPTGTKALKFMQLERPINYQIAANKLDFIEPAIERILAAGVDIVDLNAGCPANNVVSSGGGSCLMGDLPRFKAIVTKLRSVLPIPFTVKIRAGFKEKNAVEVAQMLQDCGIDALSIHPRLRNQFFEGQPDYALAAQVKAAIQIPVFISGNVVNFKMAQAVYEQTGVDGYLIGRGMWGRPWKLKEMSEHAQSNTYTIDKKLVGRYALKQLEYMLEHYGNHGLYMYRKHLPFYIKGEPCAATTRARLVVSTNAAEVKAGMRDFFNIKDE